MTAEEFATLADVSRETLARLDAYLTLLRRWQPTLNLVGRSTLRDPWRRHMWDSAQLRPLIADRSTVVDLGSGAGFPGLVLAILGGLTVHLVEADQRKVVFLREAARAAGAEATVHVGRAEALDPVAGDVVTARALAPVGELLAWAVRWLRPGGVCLLLKGRQAEEEVAAARTRWRFTDERVASRSEPGAAILRLGDIAHV
ncbi:MAG: 16S rRNA (guanine(527)-N(7))-methyltransferase RsmG [Alphaproteobacteria bacterium]